MFTTLLVPALCFFAVSVQAVGYQLSLSRVGRRQSKQFETGTIASFDRVTCYRFRKMERLPQN